MSVMLLPGQKIEMALRAHDADVSVMVTVLEGISPRHFDVCPICAAPATTNEHVPPGSMGGTVLMKTCRRCNNRLGSNVEADLLDWFDNAITLLRFSAGNVRARRSSRILLWTTPSDEVVLLVDGSVHPAISDMLRHGEVDLTGGVPDRNRYGIALLKQAYLAACAKFGIPEGDAADQVRRDLIAARDAEGRDQVPMSSLAMGLTVLRRFEPAPLGFAPVAMAVGQAGLPTTLSSSRSRPSRASGTRVACSPP